MTFPGRALNIVISGEDFFYFSLTREIFWLLTKRPFGRKSVKVDKTEPRNGQLPKRKWNNENKMNDELNNHLNRNKLVVKETIPPIIDKSSSTWICALCNNKPNQITGLGELYGPYRVSLCSDEDLIYEKNNTGIYLCYLIQCYSF